MVEEWAWGDCAWEGRGWVNFDPTFWEQLSSGMVSHTNFRYSLLVRANVSIYHSLCVCVCGVCVYEMTVAVDVYDCGVCVCEYVCVSVCVSECVCGVSV